MDFERWKNFIKSILIYVTIAVICIIGFAYLCNLIFTAFKIGMLESILEKYGIFFNEFL